MCGPGLLEFQINLRAVGLEALEAPRNLWEHAAVEQIRLAINQAFDCPLWAKLEIGERDNLIHVHALAHHAPSCDAWPLEITDLEGRLKYLSKSPVPFDALELEGEFLVYARAAKMAGKQMPRWSWTHRVPRVTVCN
jgi:hypothetical protein